MSTIYTVDFFPSKRSRLSPEQEAEAIRQGIEADNAAFERILEQRKATLRPGQEIVRGWDRWRGRFFLVVPK